MASERKWTAAQQAAMDTRGRTLLVSAAAGSGKTATLTERIIRRLTDEQDPGDISRMLVVTFTRAAAAELRERISAALRKAIELHPDSRHLQEQLLRLGSAHISTIDSFCMQPLRTHFAEVGLSAGFRMADDAELRPLSEQIMDDIIQRFYQKYAPEISEEDTVFAMLEHNDFADLCDALTPAKRDDGLPSALRDLYAKLLNYPEGIERLRTDADELRMGSQRDLLMTRTGSALRAHLQEFCASARLFYRDALETIDRDEKASRAWGPTFSYEADLIDRLSAAETYSAVRSCLSGAASPRLGPLRNKTSDFEDIQARQKKYREDLRELKEKWFSTEPAEVSADMARMARMCEVLYDFLDTYDREFSEEKRRRGICEFSDIRRYLLKLLQAPDGTPSPLAMEYRRMFDEVYIDEYQDVDAVQDTIFRLIGGDHRFMVGDIKQSIYAFRGADPSVFAGYRTALPPLDPALPEEGGPDGNSLFMSENFRCDSSVIHVTNGICGHLFRACPDSIGYTAADDLRFAKMVPEGYEAPRVQIDVLFKEKDAPQGEDTEKQDPESTRIANRIAELLRDGVKKADGTPILPEDIAILLRTKTHMHEVTAALEAAHIPVGGEDGTGAGQDLLHGADMTYLVDLLRVLDDPDRDVPLAELLRAPFPGFSLEDLIRAREGGNGGTLYAGVRALAATANAEDGPDCPAGKASAFVGWLESYRSLCTTLSAEGILRLLRQDKRVAVRHGKAFRYLYDAARSMRSGSFTGVYEFLRVFEKKLETAVSVPDEGSGKATGVSVITIHKSKGLEFPVVFLAQCGASGRAGRTPDLLFDPDCGIGMSLFDRAGLRKYTTMPHRAVALAIERRETEDSMRVLYVAMTRARERLYLVGMGKETLPPPFPAGDRYATLSCGKLLDWICAAYAAHPELAADTDLNTISASSVHPCTPLPRRNYATPAPNEESQATQDYYRHLAAEMTLPSPTEALLRSLPSKVPASRMVEDMVDQCVYFSSDLPLGDEDKLPESEQGYGSCDPRTAEAVQNSIRLLRSAGEDELELLLAEGRKPTAAERGTATHLFLQFCDHQRVLRDGLETELARLVKEGFLDRRTVEILDRGNLQKFFHSRFFTCIQEATTIRREFRFARFVPMATLTQSEALKEALADRTLYVQGSIDLLCEYPDGGVVVCDYKTDRITPAEREDPSLLAVRLGDLYRSQLRQYAAAVREIYGHDPDRVYIYSLPLGEAVEISL